MFPFPQVVDASTSETVSDQFVDVPFDDNLSECVQLCLPGFESFLSDDPPVV